VAGFCADVENPTSLQYLECALTDMAGLHGFHNLRGVSFCLDNHLYGLRDNLEEIYPFLNNLVYLQIYTISLH